MSKAFSSPSHYARKSRLCHRMLVVRGLALTKQDIGLRVGRRQDGLGPPSSYRTLTSGRAIDTPKDTTRPQVATFHHPKSSSRPTPLIGQLI